MTTEREMLEFAAKACGITAQWDCPERGMMTLTPDDIDTMTWNPLTNSADCAATCAKLEIDTLWYGTHVACEAHPTQDNYFTAVLKDHNNDLEAAWRYAATQVAAKIGGMK